MPRMWMTVWLVLGLAAVAAAQTSGEGASEQVVAGLLATGVWGGLWKGALTGVGRGLLGFFSKHKHTAFQPEFLVSAALAGAVAGLLLGLRQVPFTQAEGWLAVIGATEVLNKVVKGFWRRWAGEHVGEAVMRAVGRNLTPPKPPLQ